MITHELKIEQKYLMRTLQGDKWFEVRLNDRDYQVGDKISFLPIQSKAHDVYDVESPLPKFRVTYVHSGLGLEKGYVVLGICRWLEDE